MSPFGEAGLLGDPLYWATGGDKGKYAEFMRKTWEKPNEWLSPYAKKFHEFERKNPWLNPIQAEIDKTEMGGKIKGMSENKPGDAALAIMGAAFGGPAILGGMGGGGAAGGEVGTLAGSGAPATTGGLTNTSGLGIFANGGTGGMSTVGGGNAGLLASSGGIGGGAGMGAAGTSAGPGQLSFGQGNMQDYMQLAQSMQQPQQQQSQVQVPQSQPMNGNEEAVRQLAIRARQAQLRTKVNRTPMENYELQLLDKQIADEAYA